MRYNINQPSEKKYFYMYKRSFLEIRHKIGVKSKQFLSICDRSYMYIISFNL